MSSTRLVSGGVAPGALRRRRRPQHAFVARVAHASLHRERKARRRRLAWRLALAGAGFTRVG